MMDSSILNEPLEPWIMKFSGDSRILLTMDQLKCGMIVFHADAQKMTTTQGLYDELASVMEFPDYFGRNFSALDECITDLSWINNSDGYLLIINDSDRLLDSESCEVLEGLLSIFNNAGLEWSKPISQGEAWDRPALPFHVVLHVSPNKEPQLDRKLANIHISLSTL